MKISKIFSIFTQFLFVFTFLILSQDVSAQDVSPEVQSALQNQGLTIEQARARAEQLGIDLTNPRQAAQRARELGLPESQIRAMLQLAQQQGTNDDQPPTLAGIARITPQEVNVLGREQTVKVSASIQDVGTGIAYVDFYFRAPDRTEAHADSVQLVGGDSLNGKWSAAIIIPAKAMGGTWTLYALAVDMAGNEASLNTGQIIKVIGTEGNFVSDDELETSDTDSTDVDGLPYFGYDLFRNGAREAFEPNENGPVDDGYIVGPNDELRLLLWGATELQTDLAVDTEGRIFVRNVGQLTVAGQRLSDLRKNLKQWLSRSYAGLMGNSPSIFMDLTVTRLRPVQVYVLGEVERPGAYSISAYSSVFNVLYKVGGPLETGSLREVRVSRGGKIVGTIDLYDYLLRGYAENPVRLQNNDYIFVPMRQSTVSIDGKIRRPAYYELTEGETIADLVEYAGGLLPDAHRGHFEIQRIKSQTENASAGGRQSLSPILRDGLSGQKEVAIHDGDDVRIFALSDITTNAIRLDGAVVHPGIYALDSSVRTVSDIINLADGLSSDAYHQRADIIRLKVDPGTAAPSIEFDAYFNGEASSDSVSALEEVISIDLSKALSDDPRHNLPLQAGDRLRVYSVLELEDAQTVIISGKVINPGSYALRDKMTVLDLLFSAGGLYDDQFLKDVFTARADLFRMTPAGDGQEIIPFDLDAALSGEGISNMVLHPNDEIRVYPLDVEVLRERFVNIAGSVKNPGKYTFQESMSLEDILLQAGGFTEGAFLGTVEVTRLPEEGNGSHQRATTISVDLGLNGAEAFSFGLSDGDNVLTGAREFKLHHRDRIFVRTDPYFRPQKLVSITGEVQFPGRYTLLTENETLTDLIKRAGGILPTAYPKGGRLFRDDEQLITPIEAALNGRASADVILFSGDEVIIPPKPNTVSVQGNVANEGLIKYETKRKLSYYLDRAGGILRDTEVVLLTQASGATFRVRRGLFRQNPVVDDGAIIKVVKKDVTELEEKFDWRAAITDIVTLTTSVLTIVILAERVSN